LAENKEKKQSSRSGDVLIIGGGSVGLRAAIEAHDVGAHVLIISKNTKGDLHTVLARGGINAALGTMEEEVWYLRSYKSLLVIYYSCFLLCL
jgi:succinate dehydrogenase/fumarate reductase flavoprotein subunit